MPWGKRERSLVCLMESRSFGAKRFGFNAKSREKPRGAIFSSGVTYPVLIFERSVWLLCEEWIKREQNREHLGGCQHHPEEKGRMRMELDAVGWMKVNRFNQ